MFHFGMDIGIDLGTANVVIYIKNKGIVLNEPSVVASDTNTGKLLAVGEAAKKMLGRSPENIEVVRPLRDGVISDYKVTLKMLRHFINETCGKRRFFRPRIMVCVPSGVTEVEKKAVEDAAESAGGSRVLTIDEPLAAAIGAGLDIFEADGKMVVDIGGGTTDIAVISLGGIVSSNSIKVAGDAFNESIQRYIKKEFGILIGERTAEDIKFAIGSVVEGGVNRSMECRGQHLVTGLPKTIVITSDGIIEALREPTAQIMDAIHSVLENAPPEIAADIAYNGIVLTGGGALIDGMDRAVMNNALVPCHVADNALECVAIGTGLSLDRLSEIEGSWKKR